jgi:HPt (histidine-containing phosphotransfer) domain-containing protein
MDSQNQPGVQIEALSHALDRLWMRFLPDIKERVAILEAAAAAAHAGTISKDEQEAAEAAAHKLAGTLGTFNLPRGTILARELEAKFSAKDGVDRESGERLASLAAELRAMIAIRKSSI